MKAKSRAVNATSRVVKEFEGGEGKFEGGVSKIEGGERIEGGEGKIEGSEGIHSVLHSVSKLVSFGTVATYNSDQRHIIGSKIKNSSSNQNFHFLLR